MHLHIVTQSIIYHRVHINVSMINNDYDIKLYMYTDTIRYILYVVHCTTELLPGLTLGNFWHGFGHCMIKKETPKNDSTSSKVSWTYFLKKETPHCKQCKTIYHCRMVDRCASSCLLETSSVCTHTHPGNIPQPWNVSPGLVFSQAWRLLRGIKNMDFQGMQSSQFVKGS